MSALELRLQVRGEGGIRYLCVHGAGTQETSLEHVCATTEIDLRDMERAASNLYNVLVHVLKGKGFMVMREVNEASEIEPSKMMHREYSPSTPSTALTDLMRMVPPGKMQSHRDLIANFDEW